MCFQIQKMANFILSANVEISEACCKTKPDARKALLACDKYENETETLVWDWTKVNSKWLKKKKKVKKQEIIEVRKRGENVYVGKARIIERLCENFKPTVLLSDDGNIVPIWRNKHGTIKQC